MRCTYCDAADHLEIRCPTRVGDRCKEVALAAVVFILSLPAYILGFLGGMLWSALRTGFEFTEDFWPSAWNAIRGKKANDGESNSV